MKQGSPVKASEQRICNPRRDAEAVAGRRAHARQATGQNWQLTHFK
jgi:hypothetical protein